MRTGYRRGAAAFPDARMREISPTLSLDQIFDLLDNGGRFWNILTRAADGIISMSELAKAAEAPPKQIGPFIFLRMMLDPLSEEDRLAVGARLTPHILRALEGCTPLKCTPSIFPPSQQDGDPVIIVGVAQEADQAQFRRLLVPEIVIQPSLEWPALTTEDQPITLSHHVYVLKDGEAPTRSALVAPSKEDPLPNGVVMAVGGSLRFARKEAAGTRYPYLHPLYFRQLGDAA